MKFLTFFVLTIGISYCQTVLPWNNKTISIGNVTPPQLNAQGIFFVASFTGQGTHTDYDLARQAADAYAVANPYSGSLLVLKPGVNETCDAITLPAVGTATGKIGTTSIFGFGSSTTTILKRSGCHATHATLRHPDSPGNQLSEGWYQGFTVDANHIDLAACEFYGMNLTTLFDVSCGNAIPGADHEAEFGNRDANSAGWMDNIYIYNFRTFDTIGVGQNASLTPVWNGTALSGVAVANAGTKKYTNYVRAQIIGPNLSACSVLPALTPTLDSNGLVNGAKVTNPGKCSSTEQLYVLVQDGPPVTYGIKFSNMADSHVWDLEATGATTYGIAWLHGSNSNSIYGEHPYTNQTYQITDYAGGNRHINTYFDSPGGFGALIASETGTFENPIFGWNSSSYHSSGFFFDNDPRVYTSWTISNSQCNNGISQFVPVTVRAGAISGTAPEPSGVNLMNIQACDGSNVIDWPVSAQ